MNDQQRKTINNLQDRVTKFKEEFSEWHAKLEDFRTEFEQLKIDAETIRDEEQEKLDNMPESLQGGDRYSALETVVEELESAVGEFESFESDIEFEPNIEALNDAFSHLDNARA